MWHITCLSQHLIMAMLSEYFIHKLTAERTMLHFTDLHTNILRCLKYWFIWSVGWVCVGDVWRIWFSAFLQGNGGRLCPHVPTGWQERDGAWNGDPQTQLQDSAPGECPETLQNPQVEQSWCPWERMTAHTGDNYL